MSNLVVLCQRVYAEIEGNPKNLGALMTLEIAPPDMCYPAEFGRSNH